MCRYCGTDRLLLSIEIACSCVSTIGKESSGEKQHDDDVCAGVVVAFVAAGARGARCENIIGRLGYARRVQPTCPFPRPASRIALVVRTDQVVRRELKP